MKNLVRKVFLGLGAGMILMAGFGVVTKPVHHTTFKKKQSLFKIKDTPPTRMVFTENQWADSVFNQLSLEQKIGQLFMIATYSDRNETYYRYVDNLIKNYHIGGCCFLKGAHAAGKTYQSLPIII
ncbi:MAG: hypothetical protein R2822_17035 [Spirosomataceae bacterium]